MPIYLYTASENTGKLDSSMIISFILSVEHFVTLVCIYKFYFEWLQKGINHRLMVTSTAVARGGEIFEPAAGAMCGTFLVSESSFDFDDSMFFFVQF